MTKISKVKLAGILYDYVKAGRSAEWITEAVMRLGPPNPKTYERVLEGVMFRLWAEKMAAFERWKDEQRARGRSEAELILGNYDRERRLN